MTRFSFRQPICRLGFFIDQYAVPIMIAIFLMDKSGTVARLLPGARENLQLILTHNSHIIDEIAFAGFMSQALVNLYNAVSLWAFLIRKKPAATSSTIAEVAVPLATIAVFMGINFFSWIPSSINPLLVPEGLILRLSLTGSIIVFLGLAVSTIAIFQLRHSISALVQVREIVSKGLYRNVRHPIYLGYFIQMLGFLLVIPYLWTLFWILLSTGLFILRAKLEENKMAAHSPAYRDYMKRTPFLIPKF